MFSGRETHNYGKIIIAAECLHKYDNISVILLIKMYFVYNSIKILGPLLSQEILKMQTG